jgi:hypothetical protein
VQKLCSAHKKESSTAKNANKRVSAATKVSAKKSASEELANSSFSSFAPKITCGSGNRSHDLIIALHKATKFCIVNHARI